MNSEYSTEATKIPWRRSFLDTLSVYARLSSLKLYAQFTPALVAWSLLEQPFGVGTDELLALLLFVLAAAAMAASGAALDDLQGFRDGIDQRNYAANDPLRPIAAKPLILGEVGERAAYRFALVVAAFGMTLGVVALLVAPHHPLWLIAVWLAAAYAATQYSYGLKLSYHGAAEFMLGLGAVAVMLIPLVFLEGGVTERGWFEAYILFTLIVQQTVFSNAYDADGDRAAGRLTMVARLSEAGISRFIAGVFVVGWVVMAAGFAMGALEPWLLLALLPSVALQIAQLVNGLGHKRWLVARNLGWRACHAGVLALLLVNLLTR